MKGKEEKIKNCLLSPLEIRQSKKDENVYLYYEKSENRYICVVVKILNAKGFVITCYLTDNIKEGKLIWKK